MATLGSPGVQVQVIDESFYTPAAPGTVPLIFVATGQDKSNAAGTSTAQGTTTAKTGDVWVITSQRDLSDTFGTAMFDTDSSGNPVHASEISEYGLQAAYSTLGVSSRAYIVRADVNLNELEPSATAPVGKPNNGQHWVDTANTLFGVNEWNSITQKFVVKTPRVIDDTTVELYTDGSLTPIESFGNKGDYAVVVTAENTNTLYYKDSTNAWITVKDGFNGGKSLVILPHTSYPDFTNLTQTGSIWIKTTTPGAGASWSVKRYNAVTDQWSVNTPNIYGSTREALEKLDYTGGGVNIPVNTVFVESNFNQGSGADVSATFKLWRRKNAGPTRISVISTTVKRAGSSSFTIRESLANSTSWGPEVTVTVPGRTVNSVASGIPAAISSAGFENVEATYDPVTRKLEITHKLGGDIRLTDVDNAPLYTVGFSEATTNLYVAPAPLGNWIASNWQPLSYEASTTAPISAPADGALWFNSKLNEVDILYHNGSTWKAYRDVTAFPNTDPAGPMIRATMPQNGDRSDGGDLVSGDIWINTADPDSYGKDIYVWSGSEWVKQDVTDQYSPNGWVFADARAGITGGTPTKMPDDLIVDMLLNSHLDPDAPDPALYPKGTRLWNTRRSGNNVKMYVSNKIDTNQSNIRYEIEDNEPMALYFPGRWVTQNGVNLDGSGRFGRFAQRAVVVEALKSAIDTNLGVRDTDTVNFNLIACPGYPEVIQNMITLNADRGYTAFILGDTPFRLEPTGTALTAWGSNTAAAADNGEQGAVSYDDYGCMGLFYPSGFTTDNFGNEIVVPPSHMMLRTIINSDAKSYQWFAPAGTRRGGIENATSVGYITNEGEYKTVSLYEGIRNVMKDVKINPIATLPGAGLVNFGQYTRYRGASALDRINVARLVSYLRRQLGILAKPYLFEPNDEQTRREIKAAADSLLLELVGQSALYDFITVCDGSNNTNARIDRNELWLDVAIEPVKAVEFIYIPLRIKNTGEISAGA